MREYSVNWLLSSGHHIAHYGATYKTLGHAKRKARQVIADLNVKRCTIFAVHENKTVFDALAEKYNIESPYNTPKRKGE